MINIKRSETIPESLQDAKIQTYLKELEDWQNDKNKPEPKPPVDYRSYDVLEALNNCFLKKCYLTEERTINNVWVLEIDHFYPKGEYPHLRYEWTNLYPITSDANKMRPKSIPEGGYLDPCLEEDDVEKEIIYHLNQYEEKKISFRAANPQNIKAINTADLLDKLHNATGKDKDAKKKTENLRTSILLKLEMVKDAIIEWLNADKQQDEQAIFDAECKLKDLLSRKSSFTMLIRSTRIVRNFVPESFLD